MAGAPVGKTPAGSYTLKLTLKLLGFTADSLPVAASLALVAMDSVRSSSIFAFGVVGTWYCETAGDMEEIDTTSSFLGREHLMRRG